MVAGHCYIEKNGKWQLENLTSKEHIRGPLKAYRKACFVDIGGLKKSMGWDTIDELLALYYTWEFKTDESLQCKTSKTNRLKYNPKAKYLQGTALYKMRYGFVLAFLSALKLAFKKRRHSSFLGLLSWLYESTEKTKKTFLLVQTKGLLLEPIDGKILNVNLRFYLNHPVQFIRNFTNSHAVNCIQH